MEIIANMIESRSSLGIIDSQDIKRILWAKQLKPFDNQEASKEGPAVDSYKVKKKFNQDVNNTKDEKALEEANTDIEKSKRSYSTWETKIQIWDSVDVGTQS